MNASERSLVVGVKAGEGINIQGPGALLYVQELDDDTILDAMASDSRTEMTLMDALHVELAGVMRAMYPRIQDVSRLLIPLSALLIRNIAANNALDNRESLAIRNRRLAREQTPTDIMNEGISVGDSATFRCAGIGGHQKRIMKPETVKRYAKGYAEAGYRSALAAAEAARGTSRSTVVLETIPPLVGRLPDAVRVLEALQRQQQIFQQATRDAMAGLLDCN